MFAFIQSHYFVANILGFSLCRHCSNAERALADETSPASIGKGSPVGNLFPSRHMWPQVFSRQCSVCHGTDIAPSISVCPLRAIRKPSRADRQLRPLSLYHTLHTTKARDGTLGSWVGPDRGLHCHPQVSRMATTATYPGCLLVWLVRQLDASKGF